MRGTWGRVGIAEGVRGTYLGNSTGGRLSRLVYRWSNRKLIEEWNCTIVQKWHYRPKMVAKIGGGYNVVFRTFVTFMLQMY